MRYETVINSLSERIQVFLLENKQEFLDYLEDNYMDVDIYDAASSFVEDILLEEIGDILTEDFQRLAENVNFKLEVTYRN